MRLCQGSRTLAQNAHTFDYMISLLIAAVGLALLVIARLLGGGQTITKRAYGKVYSGAPGADAENKPDSR